MFFGTRCIYMLINFSKSCCVQFGPRCDNLCAAINKAQLWVSEMQCLWVYVVQSRTMFIRCRVIWDFIILPIVFSGKIGRTASKVILQVILRKCMLILLCGLETRSLYKYQLQSLDIVINKFRNLSD